MDTQKGRKVGGSDRAPGGVRQEKSLGQGSDGAKGNLGDHCPRDCLRSGIDGWDIGELLARARHRAKHISEALADR